MMDIGVKIKANNKLHNDSDYCKCSITNYQIGSILLTDLSFRSIIMDVTKLRHGFIHEIKYAIQELNIHNIFFTMVFF